VEAVPGNHDRRRTPSDGPRLGRRVGRLERAAAPGCTTAPAANAPPPRRSPGQMPLRAYAQALPAAATERRTQSATTLVVITPTDTALHWLRAGEATSADHRARKHRSRAHLQQDPASSNPRPPPRRVRDSSLNRRSEP
jgi:hypothetical protein